MTQARPLVKLYDSEGNASGEQLALPAVFKSPIRTDIIKFVHNHQLLNSRQAYAVNEKAGKQTSAESWGTGRAVSRIPRVPGGGTHRAGQGAFGNMCRGGRMFAPTHPWRKWHKKTNLKMRRYAVVSAIAASASSSLVMARGHKVSKIEELPLVVDDSIEGLTKTKDAVAFLKKVGADEDADKAAKSRRIRKGQGKFRNRRYVCKKGPLVIYGTDSGLQKAFSNLPGIETRSVTALKLKELAPGGVPGRFCIWTKSAFEQLDKVFGTFDTESEQKLGYKLPVSCVTNSDVSRLIQSDEVQSIVRAPKDDHTKERRPVRCKPNPLTNKKALFQLNPHAETMKKSATEASKKKSAKTKKETALLKANKEFRKVIEKESEYQGEDYEQFTNWLGLTQ